MTLPNGLEVLWDGETRAVIHAPAGLTDNIGGLCGNNNNNQRDDFSTPEGDIETVNSHTIYSLVLHSPPAWRSSTDKSQ